MGSHFIWFHRWFPLLHWSPKESVVTEDDQVVGTMVPQLNWFCRRFPCLQRFLLNKKSLMPVAEQDQVVGTKKVQLSWLNSWLQFLQWSSMNSKALVVAEEGQEMMTMEHQQNWFHQWFCFLKWSPSSPKLLLKAEEELLSRIKTKSEGIYVKVQVDEKTNCNIWTRIFNPGIKDKCPLVMLHGLGGGIALFALNFDELSKNRTVYAIDLPGYGRSSRCKFKSNPEEVEAQYVQSIENWRIKIGLNKFCLLGHSFGGYLSTAYALKHPEHVSHLILAEPWGFPEKPKGICKAMPSWIHILYYVLLKHFNPLDFIRMAGPLGLHIIGKLRTDLIKKFEDVFDNKKDTKRVVSNYIYHINVHQPTGESAFHSMMDEFLWAKIPMLPRLANLCPDIKLTALYGADSWMSAIPQKELIAIRGLNTDYDGHFTKVKIIENAEHAIHANAKLFNQEVNKACQNTDIFL